MPPTSNPNALARTRLFLKLCRSPFATARDNVGANPTPRPPAVTPSTSAVSLDPYVKAVTPPEPVNDATNWFTAVVPPEAIEPIARGRYCRNTGRRVAASHFRLGRTGIPVVRAAEESSRSCIRYPTSIPSAGAAIPSDLPPIITAAPDAKGGKRVEEAATANLCCACNAEVKSDEADAGTIIRESNSLKR